ncbi:extracellular solute-binding protein [Crassaminicella profunda]|uniref:extracellular solute-binding protein n=1 Tax=Crassaminicella profunda TaxID=1286698 RepID=UPI001CA6949C|nr:extracellular solute-binding protein [Crassaminicella profunda]QZY54115.1 extracellular solute-binding protein [Crassaminicella profunda]
MKKGICFLLMCTILFSLVGCGKNNDSKGGFYYEEIAFEKMDGGEIKGDILGVINDEEGNIYALVNRNTLRKYDSSGKFVKTFELEIEKAMMILSLGIDQGKNLYVEVKEFGEPGKKLIHDIWKLDENGKVVEKIDITKNDQDGWGRNGLSKLYINEKDDFIYKNDKNQIIQVDKTGELVNTLVSENVKDFVKVKNSLYMLIENENRETYLAKKEIGSQDFVYNQKIDGEQFYGFLGYDPKVGRLLYTTGANEIKAFDVEGNYLETAIDVENAPVFAKNMHATGFTVNNEGTIYMSYMERGSEEQQRLITNIAVFYKKEGTRPKSNKKTLTIGVNTEIDAMELKGKIAEYMKEHPDVIVKVNQYNYKEEFLSDYLKKMNTDIISGKGDDLIPTDYLPMSKYVKNGVFENLNEYMKKDKDFNIKDYYENIFKSLKVDGNYYAFPFKFRMAALVADQALLDNKNINIEKNNWNRESFINLLRAISKENGVYGLPKMSKGELFNIFFDGDINQFIDYENKKTNFDSEGFKSLLKDIQVIYEEKLLDENMDMMTISKGTKGKIGFIHQQNIALLNLTEMKNMIENFKLYPYPNSNEQGGYAFTANAYGINANSKSKELAWDFLKYLNSDNGNKEEYFFSMGMNKKLMTKSLDKIKKIEKQESIYLEDTVWYSFPLTDEEVKNTQDALKNMTINRTLDPQINKIVKEFTMKYFAKEMTEEEVIKTLDSKIATYLNE